MSRFGAWVPGGFGKSRLYRMAPFGLALVCVLGLLFSSALLAAGIGYNPCRPEKQILSKNNAIDWRTLG